MINSESDSYNKNDDDDKDIKQLRIEIQVKDNIINKLKSELSTITNNNKQNLLSSNRYINLDLKLIDNKKVSDKTDIPCWWCGYNFTNKPFFIPDKLDNETFHVFGCFCGPSCASSYNLFELNDYRSSDRHSLIIELSKLYGYSGTVEYAPQRERFERLGGDLNIDYYRNNKLTTIDSKFMLPPMIPLVPCIEERQLSKYNSNTNVVFSNSQKKQIKKKPVFGY